MEISINSDSQHITIAIPKSYDYSTVNDFYDVFRHSDIDFKLIELDFIATDYADSSSLGMLLHLKDKFPNANIRLMHCKSCLYRLFYIAKFAEIFVLEGQTTLTEQVAA